ncbi:MAG: ABC transporter permease [Opitutaceae bacterium]
MQTTIGQHRRASRNPFSSLLRNRELLWQFTERNVELRHKGSHLGLAWAVLNPLLLLALYVFAFGLVFGGSFRAVPNETPWDYALGVFLGLTIYHLLSEAIATAPFVIVGNTNFVKKVVFPLEILPVASVGASAVHFGISLILVMIGVGTVGPGFSASIVWLPVVIVPLLALSIGLAWMLSALAVFIRDIGQVVQAFTLVLLFASAIFYPAKDIQTNAPFAWTFLKFNPLLVAVDIARDATLWHRSPELDRIYFLYGCGGVVFLAGYWIFNRLRDGFADVV